MEFYLRAGSVNYFAFGNKRQYQPGPFPKSKAYIMHLTVVRTLLATSVFTACIPFLLSLGLDALPRRKGPNRVGTALRRFGKTRVRFFYPCDVSQQPTRISWLPSPVSTYILGYGVFARLPSILSLLLAGSLARV